MHVLTQVLLQSFTQKRSDQSSCQEFLVRVAGKAVTIELPERVVNYTFAATSRERMLQELPMCDC